MTDIATALAAGLCTITGGCGAAQLAHGHSAGTSLPASTAPVQPIDDAELTEQLEQGAQLLHEGGRTVPMATLIEQLKRRESGERAPKSAVMGSPFGKAATGAARSAGPRSNRELYRQARAAVLVIGNLYNCGKCEKWHVGQASGFVISADGLAVTNHHVVDRAENTTLVAMTSDGQVFPVREVIAASKADDLAILRLDAHGLTPLPIARSAAPGDGVRVISHPDGFHYTLTAGIVSRTFIGQRAGQKVPVLQITADFAKGSSGAPVLDDRGAVVGVVSYTKSIHHDNGADRKRNLQMVMKNCTPSSQIWRLLPALP